MAFEPTKEEQTQLNELTERLKNKFAEIEDKVNEYNAIVQQAQEVITSVVDRFDEEYNEKSEGWQNSQRGSAVSDFIEAWRLNLDEMEVVDCNTDLIEDLPRKVE